MLGIVQSKHKPCLGAGPEGPVGMFSCQPGMGLGCRRSSFPSLSIHRSLPHLSSPLATLQRAQLSCPTPALIKGPTHPVLFKHTHVSFVHQEKKIHLLFMEDSNEDIVMLPFTKEDTETQRN